MSKSREFFIRDNKRHYGQNIDRNARYATFCASDCEKEKVENVDFHVIEYSAYQKAVEALKDSFRMHGFGGDTLKEFMGKL